MGGLKRKVVLKVDGMTCGGCVASVSDGLRGVSGAEDVSVNLESGLATLKYGGDAKLLIDAVATAAGKDASEVPLQRLRLRVDGMSCMGCVGGVKEALNKLETSAEVEVDLDAGRATLLYAGDNDTLIQAVRDGSGKEATVLVA